MVKKSTYVMLAILVVLLLLLLADPQQEMETVYLCTKMTNKSSKQEIITTAIYDSNGNVLSTEVSTKGVSYTDCRFTYDDQNNVLSETGYSVDGEETYRRTYTYGLLAISCRSESFTASYMVSDTIIRTFDNFGNLLSMAQYSLDGNRLLYKQVYTYDALGKLLSLIIYEGSIEQLRILYTYDAQGKCLSYTEYRNASEIRYKYSYDENGNQIGIKIYRNNELQKETTNTFDTRGNLIKEVRVSGNGGSTTTTTYTYDSQNRILSEYNSHSLSYKYEYDSVGNLTKRFCHYRGTPQHTTEYEYIAIRVSAEQAKKIREMQAEVFANLPK